MNAISAPRRANIMPAVDIAGLSYSYHGPDGPLPVLRDISLNIAPGEFVAVHGASGSGKSTLMNLIGGLERPQAGRVVVAGQDLATLTPRTMEKFRQSSVAFVFQFFNLLSSLTAFENVMLGLEALDHAPRDAAERAREKLSAVGLGGKFDRYPAQLSGGEQQRVAIARALAKHVPLILADEPTGNLDEATAKQVMALFAKVQHDSDAALLLITHDSAIAQKADRVLHLTDGQFVASGGALRCA